MHPLAVELDRHLTAPVRAMLSRKGREIFFPHKGILGQAAEARGRRINATIGIALEEDGSPMHLSGLGALVGVGPGDAFTYAPSFGKAELRDVWRDMIRQKNPSLGDTPLSRPVVTNALTHALSMAGYLFLDPGDRLITPDLYWGNYRLIFAHGYDAEISTFPTFVDGRFGVEGLRRALKGDGEPGKRVVLLNFPNNPSGYTPTPAEADAIRDALVEACEAGCDVVALIDDAYFGLVYEEGVMTESIFTRLADAHERLLAVKIDGATKEDYVWGFRVGFVTYAIAGATEPLLQALADKTAGAVRGNISNASHIGQSLMLETYRDPAYGDWKAEKFETLRARYEAVKAIFAAHPEYAEAFEPLPFNSGYFMCVRPLGVDAEALRVHLLAEYDTGVIATGDLIRVAFSSAPKAVLPDLFAHLHAACRTLAAKAAG